MDVLAYALEDLVDVMLKIANGKVIYVSKIPPRMTTLEAADLLNVPHSHLMQLLDENGIASSKSGASVCVDYTDVIELKKRKDADDAIGLAELDELGQEIELGMTD